MKAPVPPSIEEVSFSCPHCGALADQTWFELAAREIPDHSTPFFFGLAEYTQFSVKMQRASADERQPYEQYYKLTELELPFFVPDGVSAHSSKGWPTEVGNLHISRCYSCNRFAVWVNTGLIFPSTNLEGPEPDDGLPQEIVIDYNEARAILKLSPRGAAALLRLCIQKLCMHLGENGKSINDDIASLVSKGLDARIQKALDIVRVIGNEAIHPGTMDLRDDPATALKLFALVNLIAERMISEERKIDALYNTLPEEKREGIRVRDKKR